MNYNDWSYLYYYYIIIFYILYVIVSCLIFFRYALVWNTTEQIKTWERALLYVESVAVYYS